MNILDRYIGKQLIQSIILVTFALLSVDVFFYVVNELRFVGKGDYTLLTALSFIFLTIPRKIYIIFPWAASLGSLLALGNLAKTSELVAMRIASVSAARIAWAAIKTGLWLSLFMFICGEVISPRTENWAQQRRTLALSRGQAIQTEFGTWVRHGSEFVHVGSIKQKDDLQDITRYSFDQNLELKSVLHAESALRQDQSWELSNTQGTKFAENGIETINADKTQLNELLDTHILQASTVKHLERLTLTSLWRLIKSRAQQELNATEYQHAFWVKIAQPVAGLVMILLAVPFAFGPLRSSSLGLKILVGIVIGFSFHTINSIFAPLTEILGLPPMWAAIIPTLMFFALGSWLIARVK